MFLAFGPKLSHRSGIYLSVLFQNLRNSTDGQLVVDSTAMILTVILAVLSLDVEHPLFCAFILSTL